MRKYLINYLLMMTRPDKLYVSATIDILLYKRRTKYYLKITIANEVNTQVVNWSNQDILEALKGNQEILAKCAARFVAKSNIKMRHPRRVFRFIYSKVPTEFVPAFLMSSGAICNKIPPDNTTECTGAR